MVTAERVKDFIGRRKNYHFNVAPRYTPGSPGQVDLGTALRVAGQEEEGRKRALTGVYGEDDRAKAQHMGLNGIAQARVQTRKGWDTLDLVTGESFVEPFKQ